MIFFLPSSWEALASKDLLDSSSQLLLRMTEKRNAPQNDKKRNTPQNDKILSSFFSCHPERSEGSPLDSSSQLLLRMTKSCHPFFLVILSPFHCHPESPLPSSWAERRISLRFFVAVAPQNDRKRKDQNDKKRNAPQNDRKRKDQNDKKRNAPQNDIKI